MAFSREPGLTFRQPMRGNRYAPRTLHGQRSRASGSYASLASRFGDLQLPVYTDTTLGRL